MNSSVVVRFPNCLTNCLSSLQVRQIRLFSHLSQKYGVCEGDHELFLFAFFENICMVSCNRREMVLRNYKKTIVICSEISLNKQFKYIRLTKDDISNIPTLLRRCFRDDRHLHFKISLPITTNKGINQRILLIYVVKINSHNFISNKDMERLMYTTALQNLKNCTMASCVGGGELSCDAHKPD